MTIEAAAASGTEIVLKRELADIGYTPSGANYGRICFEGEWRDVLRANMFLRTAGKVRVVLAEFTALSFDELFENTLAVDWSEVLPKDASVIVNAKSVKSRLFALSSIQSIVKKAIMTRLGDSYKLSRLLENGTEYSVEAAVYDNVVRLTLDTSGQGLHKRGYRTYLGEAPIRETLAAAIIKLSVWKPDRPFLDVFCGSGTIPIEAALIGLNIAPGMQRKFACEDFPNAPSLRESVQEEAESLVDRERQLRISGFDINPEAMKLALKHAEKAGVRDKIHLQVGDMRNVSSHYEHGVLISNPPYGERLLTEDELKVLYKDFGVMFGSLEEWCAYVITSFVGFEKYFGRRADKTRTLYNSELKCILYQYLGAKPEKEKIHESGNTKNI